MISTGGTTTLGLYDFKNKLDDFGRVDYWKVKPNGYQLYERAILTNGDEVKSTIADNTNDPNSTVVGWFNESKSNRDTITKAKRDNETIYDYGAVGDGTLHTVQEWYTLGATYYRGYANLAAVQTDYPFVTDANFSSDQASILKLSNNRSATGGGLVNLSKGHFIVQPVGTEACLNIPEKVTLVGNYEDTILHELTNTDDLPNESVSWDLVLFTGGTNVGGGVKNCTIRHTGGRRNNAGSIAVRSGASRKKIIGNIFENSIASSIVIEGNVATPINTKCLVSGNTINATSRHGIYLSGSKGNHITLNNINVSALEAIQNRNPSDNTLDFNNFYGVSGVEKSAIMFTQPPVGETVSYKVINYTIENNNFFDLRASAVSSGTGVINNFAKIKNNVVYMSDDTVTTEHGFQLFRFNNSEISGNYIEGGRNRGIVLYGCANNSLVNNNIKNTMSNTATGGVIQLQTHTDSIDSTVTNSTGNRICGGYIIDDRGTIKHVNAINFLTANNNNTTTKLIALGLTTSTIVASVDGLGRNNVGEVYSNIIFTKSAFGLGTQAATPMLNGSSQNHAAIKDGFVQSLRFDITQVVTSGTIRCRVFKNGATFNNILFTANNSLKFVESYFQPNQLSLVRGDILTATIESDSTTSGQTSFDVNFSIRLAE